jgi:acyl carrier protein
MSNSAVNSDRERFYASVTELLRELKPERDVPDPGPDTHLWVEGYLDSLGMLELIYFLEEQLGREIELAGDFLPSFFTLRSIYETYATGGGQPAADGADGERTGEPSHRA